MEETYTCIYCGEQFTYDTGGFWKQITVACMMEILCPHCGKSQG